MPGYGTTSRSPSWRLVHCVDGDALLAGGDSNTMSVAKGSASDKVRPSWTLCPKELSPLSSQTWKAAPGYGRRHGSR